MLSESSNAIEGWQKQRPDKRHERAPNYSESHFLSIVVNGGMFALRVGVLPSDHDDKAKQVSD